MNGIFRILGAGYSIGFGAMLVIMGVMASFVSSMAAGPCSQFASIAPMLPFNPCSVFSAISAVSIWMFALGAAAIVLGILVAKKSGKSALECASCKARVAKESNYCQNCGAKIEKNKNQGQQGPQTAGKTA